MITLFFRAKREGVNSIEMVYGNLDRFLDVHQNVAVPCQGAGLRALWENIKFARRNRTAVNHVTGDVHYIVIGTGRNTVLTIHDIGSVIYGSALKRFFLKLLWLWIPAVIVKKISVISEFTKGELSAMIPFAKNKIIVVPNAFCPKISYEPRVFNATCPTILHMGTNCNKNLERTIEALKGVRCHLNVVGKLTCEQKSLLDESGIDYENHYDVDFMEIIKFYHECDIVSFPSYYEGFGVPVLEANAAGRPIVAGDIPVLHEVGDKAACYVNPYDVSAIRDGFKKIIGDEAYRNEIVNQGFLNIKRFAPQRIAEKYNDVYDSIKW